MKKLLIILLMCVIGLGAKGQVSQEAFRQWHGDKYSMFIHFGLYSQLGGVWQGKQVKNGYSEQIQAFAPISKEDYEKIASQFNPGYHFLQLIRCDSMQTGFRKRNVGSCPPSWTTVRTVLFAYRLALSVCIAHVSS